MSGFSDSWQELAAPNRRALELAHASLAVGGLAVGAVITDAGGAIVAEGRNRAYDAPGGDDPLQSTPVAHAEMNALARIHTGTDLAGCVLWSTHEPCSMCAAAASFTGVGRVSYIAPDPSWLAGHAGEPSSSLAAAARRATHPTQHLWVVAANVLFLCSVGRRSGTDHPTIERNRTLEPETATIAVALLSDPAARERLATAATVEQLLDDIWPQLSAAADARAERTAGLFR